LKFFVFVWVVVALFIQWTVVLYGDHGGYSNYLNYVVREPFHAIGDLGVVATLSLIPGGITWVALHLIHEVLTTKKKHVDSSCLGVIKGIKYSGSRVNGRPTFIVKVDYNGIVKNFYNIDERIQSNFKIGDSVVVLYSLSDPEISKIDIDLSLSS